MPLPFLPGNTIRDPSAQNFKKSHLLTIADGHKTVSDSPIHPEKKPVPSCVRKLEERGVTLGDANQAWLALDGKVLRFWGDFEEDVVFSSTEARRTRPVVCLFYLADDTFQINEPHKDNSGLPQGTFLKRTRICKDDGTPLVCTDFDCRVDLSILGRNLHLSSCDDGTRDFIQDNFGYKVQQNEGGKEDLYLTQRKNSENALRHSHKSKGADSLSQFLEYDRHVLRLYVLWDDRDSAFGDLRKFVLHFFLASNEVEVRELLASNSGRDNFPLFLSKQKLPKAEGGFYMPEDLFIGAEFSLFGRPFLVTDADESTKAYYKKTYGIEDMTPLVIEEEKAVVYQREAPPSSGFGSEADSMVSVKSLLPKAPVKDVAKMIRLDGKILRFAAVLDTKHPVDVGRRFVVTFYLADDTIAVFEKEVRNSGVRGGKFLERSAVKNPQTGKSYAPGDLFIGTSVQLSGRTFLLVDADEFSLSYMENDDETFPRSNIAFIMNKLATHAQREQFVQAVKEKETEGTVPNDTFRDIISAAGLELSEQEIVTLLRRFDINKDSVTHTSHLLPLLA